MGDSGPFEVALAHLDGYVRVKLRGELDYPAIASAEAAKLEDLTDIRDRVVIDLSDVTFMDSAGIALLLNIERQHEGLVRLEGVPPAVRRTLELSGLDHVFDIRGQ